MKKDEFMKSKGSRDVVIIRDKFEKFLKESQQHTAVMDKTVDFIETAVLQIYGCISSLILFFF